MQSGLPGRGYDPLEASQDAIALACRLEIAASEIEARGLFTSKAMSCQKRLDPGLVDSPPKWLTREVQIGLLDELRAFAGGRLGDHLRVGITRIHLFYLGCMI